MDYNPLKKKEVSLYLYKLIQSLVRNNILCLLKISMDVISLVGCNSLQSVLNLIAYRCICSLQEGGRGRVTVEDKPGRPKPNP